MKENSLRGNAKIYILAASLALLAGFLGSLVGNFVIRKLPSTVINQSRQVVIDEQTAVVNVAKKVSPSVVSIVSSAAQQDPYTGSSSLAKTGAGTGIIISAEGLIITNKHVVEGSDSFTVFISDNTEYKNAKVIATDPFNDIAFIKVDAKGLKPAELADSDKVEVGQSVVAIGNALGQFQNTVTTGVISGKSRPITASSGEGDSESLTNLFQTDAAINPGNSGGPLVNIEGQVIGINTAAAGSAENIGFAIPINDAKSALESVIKTGKIARPYIGVRYIAINDGIAKANNLASNTGALIYGKGTQPAVLPGSPADKAGLQEGDIIIKLDGKDINELTSISSVIGKKKSGDKIEVVYLRDGKQNKATLVLDEAPAS
ncbi:MAG: trypsin-like peptidase domain-containing protein [Patescibacteria group bacterium]|nr:trypsin-like peptidase domain-containing protein [Patescibacteria group bacterium]